MVEIIGGGLAGSEAALYLAKRDIPVTLFEMRPAHPTEAHLSSQFAELVCSNSLKSTDPLSAPGILKQELAKAQSNILRIAQDSAIPGGLALTVERDVFSNKVSQELSSHPLITIKRERIDHPSQDKITIIATGPLTSKQLSHWIQEKTASDQLYFYDAIAPIVSRDSLDMNHCFLANRYDKGGESAYLNCPMNETEYYEFVDALKSGERVIPRPFEKEIFYQGCQPIEMIADSSKDALRFGPMKPVGLLDPKTNRRPFAVVQLRSENHSGSAFNLVGFQTRLKYNEQKIVFSKIPALKNAEYFRMGSIHRNTYVCGPRVLHADLSMHGFPKIYFAGQITGVEGYLESTTMGLLAAQFVRQRILGLPHSPPPANSATGSLYRHVTASNPDRFQPSGIHFGLMDPIYFKLEGDKDRFSQRKKISEQSLMAFSEWLEQKDVGALIKIQAPTLSA